MRVAKTRGLIRLNILESVDEHGNADFCGIEILRNDLKITELEDISHCALRVLLAIFSLEVLNCRRRNGSHYMGLRI